MDLSHPREPYLGNEEADFRLWFKPLTDLKKNINKRVLIIGVIVEFGIPYKSDGTDYCMNLKIVDRSQQKPELSVNFFSDCVDNLPHIKGGRDIILLHQVKIKRYKGEVNAIFDEAFSSFALFDGKGDSGTSPYQMHHNFFLHDPWRRFVVTLRNWSSSFKFDAGNTDYLVPLKDIKEGFIDLLGMVCGVHEIAKNAWVIWLWDGTDVPPLSLNAGLEKEVETYALPANIRGKFPVFGTVFQLLVDEARAKFVRHFHVINQWVKIRNLFCQKAGPGVWVGTLKNSSKVRLLTEDADTVKKCIRDSKTRERKPMSSWHISHFITVTQHRSARLATLVFLLTRAAHKTKRNCIVRVLAAHPSKDADCQSPIGIYKLRMTLEDPTARMDALLCPEDAVVFVSTFVFSSEKLLLCNGGTCMGVQHANQEERLRNSLESHGPIRLLTPRVGSVATNLFFREYQDVNAAATKIKDVLGVPEDGDGSLRNPPWIMCCIEVNHVQGGDSALGQDRVFRMCHTMLV